MKFSFMSFSCPEASLAEVLEIAGRFGYDGIEPRSQAQHRHGIEIDISDAQRREIKKRFEDSGIDYACIATSIRYNFSDTGKLNENIELTKQFISLAADTGCRRIRVFGGMPDIEGRTAEEAIDIVGNALGKVKEAAEQYRVYICLETHDFFSRADLAARAVRLANSSFVRVNWDIMHPFTMGMKIEEAFSQVKDLVAHCHVHDGTYDRERNVTLALMGKGEIPYKRAVQLLKGIKYDGYLSGEYIGAWKPDVVLPHDIKVLRSYMSE